MDAIDEARSESVRDIVGRVVMDVNELKTRVALITQAQATHQVLVSEFMLRSDQGREETARKLDKLIKSDDQWDGAHKLANVIGKLVLGFAALVGTWIAYLNLKPPH